MGALSNATKKRMICLRLICLLGLCCSAFALGELLNPKNIQLVNLLVDVNSDETVLLDVRATEDHQSGYDTNVSSLYHPLNQPFSRFYGPPTRRGQSKLTGFYAVDAVNQYFTYATNVTFGLANKIEGRDPTSIYSDGRARRYDGILGLGRSVKPGHQGFKSVVLADGRTWCHAVDCEKREHVETCSTAYFFADEANATTFARFDKNATYYGDLKPSALNPIGWSLPVGGYQYGKKVSIRSFRVTLATDSEFLTVPDSLLQLIIASLNATKDEKTGLYTVERGDYSNAEPLLLTISGKKVRLAATDLIEWTFGDRFFLKVRGGASVDEWVVGEPFTDAVAVCLDYERNLASLFKVHLERKGLPEAVPNFSGQIRLPNGGVVQQTVKRT